MQRHLSAHKIAPAASLPAGFRRMMSKRRIALWCGIAVLLGAVVLGWSVLPLEEWILSFTRWLRGFGIAAALMFALAYVVAVVLLAPAGFISVASGVIFGPWGFPLSVIAATIGAALAFLVARYLTREKVRRLTEKKPLLKAIDRAVHEEGWKIVVLLRLTPLVPFNLQNYLFGATDVRLWPYLLGTFFGIMPGTAIYVYLGAVGGAAMSGAGGGMVQIALLAVGLLAAIAVVFVIGRKAKAKLQETGIKDD